jgi:hypothetical protein
MCEARRAHLTGMQASAQSRRPGNAWGLVSVALRSDASQGAARLLRSGPPGDSFLAAGSSQTMEAK